MSASRKDRAGGNEKRRTQMKLSVDRSPSKQPDSCKQQTRSSLRSVGVGEDADSEQRLTSTPLRAWNPCAEPAAKTGHVSSQQLDPARRRTDAPVTSVSAVTPPFVTETRRSATEFRTPECYNTVAFETPGSQMKLKRTSDNDELDSDSLSSSVRVAVRVRPFMARSVIFRHCYSALCCSNCVQLTSFIACLKLAC